MLFPAVQPHQTAERAHFSSFLTATLLSPHHRPLAETWQTELEWDTGRRGLGLKVCPKISFLLRFIYCILEKIPPHPDSTNEPCWACSCYFLLYNPAKQQKRALFSLFLLFSSSQTSLKQQHEPCWWLPDTNQEAKTYQCWYVFAVCRLAVHPNSRNVPASVRFCCLLAQAFSQTAEAY